MSQLIGFSSPRGVLVVVALALACGNGEPASEGGATEPSQGSATEPARGGGLVSAEAVRDCAGFSVEDAAAVLGIPASEIEQSSQDIHETLRMCSYVRRADLNGVSFSLATNESVDEAVSGMASGREMAGLAKGSIDAVTGTSSGAPPLEEIEGIGDEAYWMEVNGTLNVRVNNVEIQVQGPSDREQQKAVARKVVEGLTRSRRAAPL
jgi:hypothetical protein